MKCPEHSRDGSLWRGWDCKPHIQPCGPSAFTQITKLTKKVSCICPLRHSKTLFLSSKDKNKVKKSLGKNRRGKEPIGEVIQGLGWEGVSED